MVHVAVVGGDLEGLPEDALSVVLGLELVVAAGDRTPYLELVVEPVRDHGPQRTVDRLVIAVVFGTFLVAAVRCARRDRSTGLFLAAPIACTLVPALWFAAAAPKHLMVVLPPLTILLAMGLVRVKAKWLAVGLAGMMAGPCLYGDVNYFARREFADASMIVPWPEMARVAKQWSGEGDTILIGWRVLLLGRAHAHK